MVVIVDEAGLKKEGAERMLGEIILASVKLPKEERKVVQAFLRQFTKKERYEKYRINDPSASWNLPK